MKITSVKAGYQRYNVKNHQLEEVYSSGNKAIGLYSYRPESVSLMLGMDGRIYDIKLSHDEATELALNLLESVKSSQSLAAEYDKRIKSIETRGN